MDRLLDARIDGRVTVDAITALARPLDALLADGRPFAVVFDRRAMTAPTAEGRQALADWAARTLPRLAGVCVAWADVLDERRIASLARAGGEHRDHLPYPQRTFADPDEARAWAAAALDPDQRSASTISAGPSTASSPGASAPVRDTASSAVRSSAPGT